MIGQKMNFKKYQESLKNNPGPISISQIPKVKIDYKGLIAYAKAKNMRPGDLSDEEKNKFFLDGHNMEWVRANAGYKITV